MKEEEEEEEETIRTNIKNEIQFATVLCTKVYDSGCQPVCLGKCAGGF
jgi:hypothetical protein